MGSHRPFKTKCWENYLLSLGCKFHSEAKGSHVKWKCPNCWRSIIFRGNKKTIPADHVRSNMKTLNRPYKEFVEWAKVNC